MKGVFSSTGPWSPCPVNKSPVNPSDFVYSATQESLDPKQMNEKVEEEQESSVRG